MLAPLRYLFSEGEDIVHANGNTWKNMNKAPVAEAVGGSLHFSF